MMNSPRRRTRPGGEASAEVAPHVEQVTTPISAARPGCGSHPSMKEGWTPQEAPPSSKMVRAAPHRLAAVLGPGAIGAVQQHRAAEVKIVDGVVGVLPAPDDVVGADGPHVFGRRHA